jgi:hypothetical protein
MLYRLLYERETTTRIYASFAITGASEEDKAKIDAFKARLSADHIVFDPYKIIERGPLAMADALLTETAEALRDESDFVTAYAALRAAAIRATSGTKHESTIQWIDSTNPRQVLPALADMSFAPSEQDRRRREDRPPESLFEPYHFDLYELDMLAPVVDGQIISRDYLLIDQSHVVCALIPWNDREKRPDISAGSQSELTYAKMAGKPSYVVCEGDRSRVSPWVVQHAKAVYRTLEELETVLRGECL